VTTGRIQTPAALLADDELDRSLRPRRLEEFVGQPALREQLSVSLEAAAARGEALDHVLLAGPPGLGKTSLAQILAAELDVPFVQTAGPALERKGDIAAFLTALEPRSVFFVDELHRLPRALEETFYPAMEDRQLPITVGQGAGARVVTAQAADAALELLGIDRAGLDPLDRELLDAICVKFGGGPVGLSTLAVVVGEEADTIEDVYEPYLLQQGLLARTPRGRCATAAAYAHLGLPAPDPAGLF